METSANKKPNIRVVSNQEDFARQVVELFISDATQAINSRDVFHVALSGGNTPKRFYELLGQIPAAESLAWDKIHLFWVDERYVPQDSPWSNFKLVSDTFLKKVSIPEENVHPIETDCCDFNFAAQQYEKTIRDIFSIEENQLPVFDLIMLGMGSDGHTGSLFPNNYALFDTSDLAAVVYVMDEKLNRITLTHPVLSAASHLVVLVSGEEKAEILKQVFTSEPDEIRYPIHVLWPVLDKITWLVDDKAAKLL